jgi:hypothetical protein
MIKNQKEQTYYIIYEPYNWANNWQNNCQLSVDYLKT